MSPEEEKARLYIETIDKICLHIDAVQRNCKKLAERLILNGELEFGRKLIAHAYIHDNSKFYGLEFDFLTQRDDKDKLFLAVRNHQQLNAHHPEHWGSIHEMPRLYIAEMVCDWLARSQEFGTGVRDFVKIKAMPKYDFKEGDECYKQIEEFISLLCHNDFA